MKEKTKWNNYDALPLILDVTDIQHIMGISRASALSLIHIQMCIRDRGYLTLDMMRVIMGEEKKSDLDRVTFTSDTLRKYFPKSYTPQRMQETIIKLLEAWQKKRQRDQER